MLSSFFEQFAKMNLKDSREFLKINCHRKHKNLKFYIKYSDKVKSYFLNFKCLIIQTYNPLIRHLNAVIRFNLRLNQQFKQSIKYCLKSFAEIDKKLFLYLIKEGFQIDLRR